MLKKGKLTEVGNHETLLRDYPEGVYAKLVKQQQDADKNGDAVETELDDVEIDVDEVDGNIDINQTK